MLLGGVRLGGLRLGEGGLQCRLTASGYDHALKRPVGFNPDSPLEGV